MEKVFITVALSVIAILLYDRIKKRCKKNNAHKKTIVFLRANNAYIRKKLRERGFNVCTCANLYYNDWLYATTDGAIVCGFNENKMHIVDDARKNGMRIADCAKNLSVFVKELQNLDVYEGNRS